MQLINPKTIKTVDVGDAKFQIGVLPFGRRTEIETLSYLNRKAESLEQLRQIYLSNYETVRWGIKGHSGLKFGDEDVPFILDEKQGCVSEETMEVYAANGTLLLDLSKEVRGLNYLQKDAVKN